MSPVLASLFLHYAFDLWLGREFPRPSSSVTPTMRWFTARVCRRHSGSWPRCGSERPRWGWSCAPVRRGSCTARTATAAAGSSTGSSRSCGSPSGRAAPRTGAVVLHRVPARDQQESSEEAERDGAVLATAPAHREFIHRTGRLDQSGGQFGGWLTTGITIAPRSSPCFTSSTPTCCGEAEPGTRGCAPAR